MLPVLTLACFMGLLPWSEAVSEARKVCVEPGKGKSGYAFLFVLGANTKKQTNKQHI